MALRKFKLNFHANSAGTHEDAWRQPYATRPGEFGIGYYQEIAQIAERGLFDAIFFADTVGLYGGRRRKPVFDPAIIIAAITAVTERIGLVASASTTFSEPYNLARQFSTLDHVSNGRVGWNVVTTYNENAATNFGLVQLPEKPDRYKRAEEFVDVVLKLWDGWDYQSLDLDPAARHERPLRAPSPIDHAGRFFHVKGPLQVPKTPQRHPVVFQAGGSEEGRALAGRVAEGVFSQAHTVKEGQAYYTDLKRRAVACGRHPDSILIFPGVYVYLGSTEQEVARIWRDLQGSLSEDEAVRELANTLHADVSELKLDQPIPVPVLERALSTSKRSTVGSIVALAREDKITVRALLARQPGALTHRVLVGTPEQIACSFEEWFLNKAADGFNIGNLSPRKLGDFVDAVIPELQRRGLYRTEYQGSTLRSHYREDTADRRAAPGQQA